MYSTKMYIKMTSTKIQKYNSTFTNESSYKFAFYLNVKKNWTPIIPIII